jgi:hypothetical protein
MMAALDMYDHRVHVDAVNGERLSLALNAPAIALSGNVIQRSLELTRWLKRQRLGVVLIAGDLAWGTAQRAAVVGAQVMGWPLIGGVVTLFWPLDDGVYTAVISDAEGEVSVVDGSEQVLSIDQALEFADRSNDVLFLDGGAATEQFRLAGYVISSEHRLSPAFMVSRSRLSTYTRKGMPHIMHGVMLVLGVCISYGSYAFEQEMQRREALSQKVVTVPPRGSAKLREELRTLVRIRQRVEVLDIYGLDKMVYDPKASRVTLMGTFSVGDATRLRQFADAIGADLSARGSDWRMVFDAEIPSVKPRDLHALETYLAAILTALTAKPGWRATIESYVNGGSPLLLQGGLRLLSRDYTEVSVAAVVEADPRPLAVLLGVVERIPGGVNGRLGDVRLEFNNDGRVVKASLSFLIRGKKAAA